MLDRLQQCLQTTTTYPDNIKLRHHKKSSILHYINGALENFENSRLKDKSQNLQEKGQFSSNGKESTALPSTKDSSETLFEEALRIEKIKLEKLITDYHVPKIDQNKTSLDSISSFILLRAETKWGFSTKSLIRDLRKAEKIGIEVNRDEIAKIMRL